MKSLAWTGSPVLGYLAAGVLIGPYTLSIIKNVHGTKMIAEFGVVFLLFNIGLEVLLSSSTLVLRHMESSSIYPTCFVCFYVQENKSVSLMIGGICSVECQCTSIMFNWFCGSDAALCGEIEFNEEICFWIWICSGMWDILSTFGTTALWCICSVDIFLVHSLSLISFWW